MTISSTVCFTHTAARGLGTSRYDRHSDFGGVLCIILRYGSGCCCGFAPHFPILGRTVRQYVRSRNFRKISVNRVLNSR